VPVKQEHASVAHRKIAGDHRRFGTKLDLVEGSGRRGGGDAREKQQGKRCFHHNDPALAGSIPEVKLPRLPYVERV
jgi:hypothetical protein